MCYLQTDNRLTVLFLDVVRSTFSFNPQAAVVPQQVNKNARGQAIKPKPGPNAAIWLAKNELPAPKNAKDSRVYVVALGFLKGVKIHELKQPSILDVEFSFWISFSMVLPEN